jgi:hypothetical protein
MRMRMIRMRERMKGEREALEASLGLHFRPPLRLHASPAPLSH